MAISNSSMPRTAKLYAASRKVEIIMEERRTRGISSPEDEKATRKSLKAAESEKEKQQFRVNFQWLFAILLLVTVVLIAARALAERPLWQEALKWLFEVPAAIPQAVGDFATVLAPLLAISVAIERLLETAFNWYEQSLRAVADVLVAPQEMLDWIGKEYQNAYEATNMAAEVVGAEMTSENLTLFAKAEDRLSKAEERLRGWVQAPEYLAYKRALSIWFGLLVGLIISILGDLGMLRYIGLPSPRCIDMIVTGLVIGSGPGPMHDLIGILQSGKNALSSLTDLAKGKSIQEAVAAVRREQTLQNTEEA